MTREDRARQRQQLVAEFEELKRQEKQEKQSRYEKRRAYDADLIGQMEYNRGRELDDWNERQRMSEAECLAERQYNQQIKYFNDHPDSMAFEPNPLRLKAAQQGQEESTRHCYLNCR